MSDRLGIANEMRVLDSKDRQFYDSLTDEERKKFSPYLMMRYAASVEGSADFQEWYLRATNERVNVNFFDVSTTKHSKLQWLLCTTVSPNMGTQRHYWITAKKKTKDNPTLKLLKQLYPKAKNDELNLLAKLNSTDDIKKLAREHGFEERELKK